MKKTNRWIRPLNWHTPQKPVVRQVSNSDLPSETPTAQPTATNIVEFQMTNDNWIQVLKCLQLYAQKQPSPEWHRWRLEIREKVLGAVNANTNRKLPVAVHISELEWRELLKYTNEICIERGEQWHDWHNKLKHRVEAAIKNNSKSQ
jgi:hypothetical protein